MESVPTSKLRPSVPASHQSAMMQRINPMTPYHFTGLGWTITALVLTIILLPAVAYPLGPDEGLFFVSAQKILQGAIHYRDIVDIKPPLIYYFYAGAIWLLGPTSLSIHIIDVLLQGLTCVFIIRLVRQVSGNDLWGATSAVIYALLYFILNYSNVAQPESYVGLLGIPMIRLLMYRRTPRGYLLLGLLGGILFVLKFSLLAVLGSLALADVLIARDNWRLIARNWCMMGIGFAIIFGLLLLYLFLFDAYKDFLLMQQFTRGYVSIQSTSFVEWFRSVTRQVPGYLSDNYSIVLFLATATGISLGIPLRSTASKEQSIPADALNLLRICTVLFLVLVITVAIESKFIPYHFSRFYAFSAILAACGGMWTVHSFLLQRRHDRFMWVGTAFIAFLLFVCSPIPRYFWHGKGVIINALNGAAAIDDQYSYLTVGDTSLTFSALHNAGTYLRNHRHPEDQVLLASSAGGVLAYEARYIPDFKIYHFAFVAAPFGPQEWKDATRDYIFTTRPRFVVTQLYNHEPTLSGTRTTSEEALFQLPGVDSLMHNSYHLVYHTGVFNIYERK